MISVALMLLGTGCLESKYRYVVSGAEKVSFWVTRSWSVYHLPTGAADRLSPSSPGDVQLIWSTGFDADPNATVDHLEAMANYGQVVVENAVGVAAVYQVQGSYNQKLSLTEARKAPLGVDPLYVPDDVRSLVEIISYKPFTRFKGVEGSQVRFNMRARSDAPWSTYEMVALIDQSHYRMYTFIVGCIGRCFEDHQSSLADVVNSWRIEK